MRENWDLYLEEEPHRGRFSRIGWALLAYLLAGAAFQAAAGAVLRRLAPGCLTVPAVRWGLSVCASYGIAFPVFARILRKIPPEPPAERRPFGPLHLVEAYLMALAAAYGANFVTLLVTSGIEQAAGRPVDNPVETLLAYPAVLSLILTCVLAPAAEEIMFRGMILNRLRPYGEKFAVLASALLFGLLHGNLSQILYAFAVGVVLGGVAVRSGCLWQAILLHALVNGVSSGLVPLLAEWGGAGEQAIGLIVLGSLLLGALCFARRRREWTPQPGGTGLEEKRVWRLFFRNWGMGFFVLLVAALCVLALL